MILEPVMLSGNHPLIRDHQVHGEHWLPGLAYIDLIYQAWRKHGWAADTLAIHQLRMYQPLSLDPDAKLRLLIEGTALEQGKWRVGIRRESEEADPANGLYASAEVHFNDPVRFTEKLTGEEHSRLNEANISLADVYEACRKQGLVHGSFMQASGRLAEASSELLMALSLENEALAKADSFLFHPVLLDAAAVGMGRLLTGGRSGQLVVPLGYELFRAAAPLRSPCTARIRTASVRRKEELVYATVELFDEAGFQVAELRNLFAKEIRETPVSEADPLLQQAVRLLQEVLGGALGRPPEQIPQTGGYYEMGLNSRSLLESVTVLEEKLSLPLPPTLWFEYTNAAALAAHLVAQYPDKLRQALPAAAEQAEEPAQAANIVMDGKAIGDSRCEKRQELQAEAARPETDDGIAVIGMAGRYPGADNLRSFWDNLRSGRDSVTAIPPDRWDRRSLDGLASPSGKPMSGQGGFIADPGGFDPQFFRISPREAEVMDPQERLFLEISWEALEDGGYTPERLTGSQGRRDVGVFAGVMHKDYTLVGAQAAFQGRKVPLSLNYAQIANRVSYFCNFTGPSLVVDTVCSSSLTAVHLAAESLRRGECGAALAGGVNLSLHPFKYMTYGLADMYSSSGRCQSFGEGGDGFVSAEGVGAVLLKPLRRAVEDGDRIYAVIRGSAVNHVGTVSGPMVPSPVAQAEVIGTCLERAGVDARTVSYVEAHGTGTSLGDPIELDGLTKAYRQHTGDRQFCAIGSVKSNIGHAEAAAGICGLHKTILQLYHRTLVPSLHADALNPYIRFEETPFYVQREASAWERPRLQRPEGEVEVPRRAGLSSFGATGSNAHILLEEYDPAGREGQKYGSSPADQAAPYIIVLSAKTKERLEVYLTKLAEHVKRHSAEEMAPLAYTLQTGRRALEERIALVVQDMAELAAKLGELTSGRWPASSCWRGTVKPGLARELATAAAADSKTELAEAWVQGKMVNWEQLYGGRLPGRTSAPTYPFLRERYWIPQADMPHTVLAGTDSSGSALLHPLLHRNTSNFTEQRYSTVWTGEEWFLDQHRIGGQRLLPASAYMEMARAALACAVNEERSGADRVVLTDLRWLRPLVVEQTVNVHIGLTPDIEGVALFEVYSEPAGDSGERIVYCEGQAAMLEAEGRPVLDLAAWTARCGGQRLSGEACYAAFESAGMIYGPQHKGIEHVLTGDSGLLVKLTLPAAETGAGGLMLHPGMVDSMLQASMAFALAAPDQGGQPALPYTLERMEAYAPCEPDMWALIRRRSSTRQEEADDKLDFDLCDTRGRVCLSLRGLTVRSGAAGVGHQAGPQEPFHTGLRKQAHELLLFTPSWRQADRSILRTDATVKAAKHIVLAAGFSPWSDREQLQLEQHLAETAGQSRCVFCPVTGLRADEAFEQTAETLLAILQEAAAGRDSGEVVVQVACYIRDEGQMLSGLGGMLNAAVLEQPKLRCQLLELTDLPEPAELALLLKEVSCVQKSPRWKWREGMLYQSGWQEETRVQEPAELWTDGGIYLITGGMGGLGRLVAQDIARQAAAPALILTGRSPWTASMQGVIDTLRSLGAKAEYRQMDAANPAAVQALLQEIKAAYGGLNGILHSAGVLRDSFLLRKNPAELNEVLAPKVKGLVNLDEATANWPLDWFILFSSTAARFGNVGQADYAAANAFMDAYAAYRSQLVLNGKRQGRTLSVNWPLWREGGMKVDSETARRMEQSSGMSALETAEGLKALRRAAASGQSQMLVVRGQPKSWRQGLLFPEHIQSPPHRDEVLRVIRSIASRLLGVGETELPVETPWEDNGFDPVLLIRLSEGLQAEYGLRLETGELMDYGSMAGLADALAGRLLYADPYTASSQKMQHHAVHSAPLSVNPAEEEGTEPLEEYLKRLLSAVLRLPAERIDAEAALEEYGLDSIMTMQMTEELEKTFGPLSKTLLYEYQSLRGLAGYLWTEHRERAGSLLHPGPEPDGSRAVPARSRRHAGSSRFSLKAQQEPPPGAGHEEADVAIIGVAGRYPQADNIQQFWRNLQEGRDCITEIPKARWDHSLYYSEERHTAGKTYSKWGGFIDGADCFDPLFFHISPVEAEVMDPQERLFLQCVHETLEDAGYTRQSLERYRRNGLEGNVGVFVGVMYEEYQLYGAQEQARGHAVAYAGNASSVANRVSYYFNFHGPSLTLDTMCSSSLTAIHLACQSLRTGGCEVAVAGGVNVCIHPNKYLMLAQGNFASSKGRCESFGAGGDGYVPGEGVGAVLLKPLHLAVADGDRIYGVIKGTAINHGGKTNGYSVPNPGAQAEVIRHAYREAGVDPATVSYLEAHGTGTSLGDPIEITGLGKVFQAERRQYCAIGSVKSNIGHTESAAGIAGLTKVLLQMKHRQLVPSLHAGTLNPYIDFAASPFRVQRELSEWKRPVLDVDGKTREYPRRAGISAFGAGGSNAHVVLEEYTAADTYSAEEAAWPTTAAILLSARDEAGLKRQAEQLLQRIREQPEIRLHELAYTLQIGREAMEERLAFIADTVSEAEQKLQAYLDGTAADELMTGSTRHGRETIRLFAGDEELRTAVHQWLARRKYRRLLALWVQGLSVDWEELYEPGARPARIALPAYPFARIRCWAPRPLEALIAEQEAGTSGRLQGAASHPLVHENTSDLTGLRFTTTFTGRESFFRDHIVMGRAVLPAAAHLEWVRAAWSRAVPEQLQTGGLRITQVTWVRPLVVGSAPVTVHIGLYPGPGGEMEYEIYGLKTGGLKEERILYSRGRAEAYKIDAVPVLPLDVLRGQCAGRSMMGEACYELYSTLGITYGPAHQALKELHGGESGVLAALALPGAEASGFTLLDGLSPGLLDAAFQASIGVLLPEAGGKSAHAQPLMPYAMNELEFYSPCSASSMAWVRASGTGPGAGHQLDIDICDDTGKVSVRIRGISSRPAKPEVSGPAAAGTDGLPAGTAELTLAPVWDTALPVRTIPSSYPADQVLVIGGTEADALDEIYPEAKRLRIHPSEPVQAIASLLEDIQPIRHILWLPPETPQGQAEDLDLLLAAQQEGVLSLFRLLKAALLLGYGDRTMEWTFFTCQSQQVLPGERIDPAHAGVHGMVGALAKEYPNWSIRLVDREAGGDYPVSEWLDLPADPQGEAWARRGREWYRQKLVPVEYQGQQPSGQQGAFRRNGVYVVIGGAGGIGEAWSEYMIRTYQARIVWLGRRTPDAALEAKLSRLAAFGQAPLYLQADASDRTALEDAYAVIKKSCGAIHGIIHSAIVLKDQSLAKMEESDFRSVLSAKAEVSLRLAQVFGQEPLDFVLFFSSMNAFTKGAGQSNYAAGCTFKDAFAHYLAARWTCKVKIMNWGYWGTVGAVASDDYRERMARLGLASIEPPEAMQAIEQLLNGPLVQTALVKTASALTGEYDGERLCVIS